MSCLQNPLTTPPAPIEETMKIPLDSLSEDALAGIVEAFVLREGTDYGEREFSLAEKCAAVRRQLERGDAEIHFDPASGSTDVRLIG